MDKRKLRDILRFISSLLLGWLYILHIVCWWSNTVIISDVVRILDQIKIKLPRFFQLIYLLHNNRYFRTLFYHRIGPVRSALIQWYRPGDRYFCISSTTKISESMWFAHPYATILNAESIGKNFSCIHCTTLGATSNGRPTIGDNVSLGANVTIIGNVKIGNNVTIGAGSVVVKDLPDNCVAAGNPARVIRFINY